MASNPLHQRRVPIVDDNPAIHEDFRKILCGRADDPAGMLEAEPLRLGEAAPPASPPAFRPHTAIPSQRGVARVKPGLAKAPAHP